MSDSKDLWELGQVKGRQDERERIIKLLEKLSNAYYKTGVGSAIETAAYEKAVALIKGEK